MPALKNPRHEAFAQAVARGAPLISIVDDDPLARDGICELIESLGYKAVTFISAEHFLESGLITETMPDH